MIWPLKQTTIDVEADARDLVPAGLLPRAQVKMAMSNYLKISRSYVLYIQSKQPLPLHKAGVRFREAQEQPRDFVSRGRRRVGGERGGESVLRVG